MLMNRARQGLTAGTAKQAVDDRGRAGHSLFTSFVLEGLRGSARRFGHDVITGSELMVYVKTEVAKALGSRQTPDFGYLPGHESGEDFLFRLPGFSAQEHLELGTHLYSLGRETREVGCLLSAAKHFREAVKIVNKPIPEAYAALGETLLATGDIKGAIDIPLAHFASNSQGCENLLSIVDAGFTRTTGENDAKHRFVSPIDPVWSSGSQEDVERRVTHEMQIGGLSIFPLSLGYSPIGTARGSRRRAR
jgi:hypothetical protein